MSGDALHREAEIGIYGTMLYPSSKLSRPADS